MSRCVPLVDEAGNVIGSLMCGPDARRYTGREASAKWCRRCRRKLVHKEVMLYDSEPSYYDPVFVWECPCGTTT